MSTTESALILAQQRDIAELEAQVRALTKKVTGYQQKVEQVRALYQQPTVESIENLFVAQLFMNDILALYAENDVVESYSSISDMLDTFDRDIGGHSLQLDDSPRKAGGLFSFYVEDTCLFYAYHDGLYQYILAHRE